MRIISYRALREFIEKHPDAASSLKSWYKQALHAEYHSFQDLTNDFGAQRVDKVDDYFIFDVGGNKFRLITVIHFDKQKMYIREVLTHAEYDKKKWRK